MTTAVSQPRRRRVGPWLAALITAVVASVVLTDGRISVVADPQRELVAALARLRRLEGEVRAAGYPTTTWERAAGPDPRVVVAVDDARHLGLRGDGAMVLLEGTTERARRKVALGATGLAFDPATGTAFAVGRRRREVTRARVEGASLRPLPPWPLPRPPRDVATDGVGGVVIVDDIDDRLLHVDANGRLRTERRTCAGPKQVVRVSTWLGVRCGIAPEVQLWRLQGGTLDASPHAVLEQSAPAMGIALRVLDEGVEVAWAGPEDHDLDRSAGFFGYVDSALTRITVGDDGRLQASAPLNLSAHGVVDPHALQWHGAELLVTGYGGETALAVGDAIRTWELPPGTRSIAPTSDGLLLANPLLDAWVSWSAAGGYDVHRLEVGDAPELRERRLGEVLAFTSLMAPGNESDDAHSRFSCGTCHYEGGVDGRTHRTGRFAASGVEVRATTKPLRGLFNNRPHFSRALDRDLTRVAHAEFRVAGLANGQSPWFSLRSDDHPWLRPLLPGPVASPEQLRRALLRFLMHHTHLSNPLVTGRDAFDAEERRGAAIFQARCASCHAPRESTDATTAVPLASWERHVFGGAPPLVWASRERRKTGVLPYVHREGARTTSLRRLVDKRPYFTNGSAPSLADVLERVGWTSETFFHDGSPAGATRLEPRERDALRAFLRLL